MNFFGWALPVLAFLAAGCGGPLKGVVVDANGLAKEVQKIRTDKGGTIEVLDGLAFREIDLSKVSVINISPKDFQPPFPR